MTSDRLKNVLQQFINRPLPCSRPRDLTLPINTGKVVGLAGVRRAGRTFLFFETMQRLIAQGVSRRQLIYLNFEDDRLQPLRAAELDLVLRAQRELLPETIGPRCQALMHFGRQLYRQCVHTPQSYPSMAAGQYIARNGSLASC